jgi:inositol 1,4,5-triphosphate receptor type 1/inositol 1,4,5-triphosphate receptor type 3
VNLTGIYNNFCTQYSSSYYERKIFNHFDTNDQYDFSSSLNPQDLNPKYYSLIIETGFLIFHLLRAFYDNEDPENRRIVEYELPHFAAEETEARYMMGVELLSDLSKLGVGFFKSALSTFKRRRNQTEPLDEKRSVEEAHQFFSLHTGSVEVVFTKDSLWRVYFSLPPFASNLTPEMKEHFHLNVDRSSDKRKQKYLVDVAPELIEEMKHEHRLNKLLSKNFCIKLIAKHVRLWRELAWYMTLLLNFFILASYSTYSTDRTTEPSLFYVESKGTEDSVNDVQRTKSLFNLLGTIQSVCAGMVVLFFLMKSGPVLAKRGWAVYKTKGGTNNSFYKCCLTIKRLVKTIGYVLSNFETVYYSLYVVISILGTIVHPFYFSLHLLDILHRYPSLQNVVRSITKPKKSLILTFLFMIVLIYLFSIWGYSAFSSFYYGNCPSLAICLITTFDQGFKNGGGVGEYLEPWGSGTVDIPRLLYDNLFNIIIMIIMLNIVQGIIIDTFAVLREEQERNLADIELKCFICGLSKEEIERGSSTSFELHKFYEHNEWNYLHFIAYLTAKDETELTGVESYIREKLNAGELDWFPTYRALRVKTGDLTENAKLLELVSQLSQRIESLEKRMKVA